MRSVSWLGCSHISIAGEPDNGERVQRFHLGRVCRLHARRVVERRMHNGHVLLSKGTLFFNAVDGLMHSSWQVFEVGCMQGTGVIGAQVHLAALGAIHCIRFYLAGGQFLGYPVRRQLYAVGQMLVDVVRHVGGCHARQDLAGRGDQMNRCENITVRGNERPTAREGERIHLSSLRENDISRGSIHSIPS